MARRGAPSSPVVAITVVNVDIGGSWRNKFHLVNVIVHRAPHQPRVERGQISLAFVCVEGGYSRLAVAKHLVIFRS
jgi:hypothetical protein